MTGLRKILYLLACFSTAACAQYNLNYFIDKAWSNSPALKDYGNLMRINTLQKNLDEAQNAAVQVYLSSNVLFPPYFNNNGVPLTPNPNPSAIGYDAAVTNGGLYSAQVNFEKNIFNGGLLNALSEQRLTEGKIYEHQSYQEKHDIEKQVTDQYLSTLQQLLLYNLSKEIKNNLQNQLAITGNLVAKGYSKAQDYLLLKIEVKSQEIEMNLTWQNYKSGIARLYLLCGIRDTQTVLLDSVELTMSGKKSGSDFLTQYYLDSLHAAAQQQVFETKYLPQVNLFFNGGLNAVELNGIERKFGVSAGLNFSLPILDGGQQSITRQQTSLAEETLSEYKNYFAGNISTQRNDAESRIASLKKNLDDLKAQIGDYKKVLELSESELQRGTLSMVEYLTVLKNYVDLQKNTITAGINYRLEISNYNYWNW
ncbi:MAG: TolC family protein [Bacteroidota bacterium]|nr:TolC family protein [Bacteroidota bacterium]